MTTPALSAVIFDLGGVVLSWDPRRAYASVLDDEAIGPFLERIDFFAWNHGNDGGGAFADAEQALIERFPDDRAAILSYRINFAETLTGMVPGTGAVLAELAGAGVRLVALTNWSAETFPHARGRFGLLRRFEDIVVSGTEGLVKPDPALYRLALDRHGLDAATTAFVDDMPVNVEAADAAGITGLRFTDAEQLRADLVRLGVLEPRVPIAEPVFHLAERAAWAEAEATGRYPWSSRGVGYDQEGFVHASFGHQVAGVRERYYADLGDDDLVLLELDRDRLPIVVEDLGHGPFPHVFAELTPADAAPA